MTIVLYFIIYSIFLKTNIGNFDIVQMSLINSFAAVIGIVEFIFWGCYTTERLFRRDVNRFFLKIINAIKEKYKL